MNTNSVENQRIKARFVEDNVLACQTGLIEELLSQELISYEAPEMYYCSPLHSGAFEGNEAEKEARIEELEEKSRELDDFLLEPDQGDEPEREAVEEELENIQEDISDLKCCEPTYGEPLEWWLVNSWLAEKLEAEDEIIIEEWSCHWWGRQTSGQAILLDGVISRICHDLNMLDDAE